MRVPSLFSIAAPGISAAALGISAWLIHGASAQDQEKPPAKAAIAPAEKLADGWEEIDDRLLFLMVRLANTEASLEAVENAIAGGSRKQMKREGEGRTADKKNEDMDRKGGGPVQWYKFYGKTAEKFYFHPPGRDPIPIGRPPQFDFIYRANEKAKARAEEEVQKLRGKTGALLDRRRRLEAEQAELWCDIAFHAVAHRDLHKRPLYRFEPRAADDADARQHAEAVKSVALFMRLALSLIDLAQEDQAATFSKIKAAVADARQVLDDSWLQQGVDASDKKTTEGKFAALAKRLDEMASNLSESYLVAVEGARDQDQQRKDTFRGLLQESLVNYAETILALDELAVAMRDQWQIKPDTDRPIPAFTLATLDSAVPGKPDDIGAPAKAKIGDDDSRVRWLNESYNTTVRFVKAKKVWEQVDNKTGRVISVDREVARTDDYVEVYSPERKLEIRIRADKMELKQNGQWSWVANGRWEGAREQAKKKTAEGDKRARWINESYQTTVSLTGEKKWADVHDKTGDVWNTYVEKARTDDYIEVYCVRTKDTIRYSSKKAEVSKDGRTWQWVANGHWDNAED